MIGWHLGRPVTLVTPVATGHPDRPLDLLARQYLRTEASCSTIVARNNRAQAADQHVLEDEPNSLLCQNAPDSGP